MKLKRGTRYNSRRFFHEHTAEPMSAYVVGEYVIERARRDWNHRVAGQYVGSWAGPKEWWEVRRQASRGQPGFSIGRNPLFQGNTLRECMKWIGEQS